MRGWMPWLLMALTGCEAEPVEETRYQTSPRPPLIAVERDACAADAGDACAAADLTDAGAPRERR